MSTLPKLTRPSECWSTASGATKAKPLPSSKRSCVPSNYHRHVLLFDSLDYCKFASHQVSCNAHFHFVHVDLRASGRRNSSLRRGKFRFVTVAISLGSWNILPEGGHVLLSSCDSCRGFFALGKQDECSPDASLCSIFVSVVGLR